MWSMSSSNSDSKEKEQEEEEEKEVDQEPSRHSRLDFETMLSEEFQGERQGYGEESQLMSWQNANSGKWNVLFSAYPIVYGMGKHKIKGERMI